jgi:hypothetical protein
LSWWMYRFNLRIPCGDYNPYSPHGGAAAKSRDLRFFQPEIRGPLQAMSGTTVSGTWAAPKLRHAPRAQAVVPWGKINTINRIGIGIMSLDLAPIKNLSRRVYQGVIRQLLKKYIFCEIRR